MYNTVNQLKRAFDLDAIYCIDVETYYDSKYSLRGMATTEYITDERFELQLVAIRKLGTSTTKVYTGPEFVRVARGIDWRRVGVLAHHAQFDGLILSYHLGIVPKMYFDTLSMARPIMPVTVGGSLVAIAKAFGYEAKKRAQALVDVKGKRLSDFTYDELKSLKLYAGDDVDATVYIFDKMLPYVVHDELRLIHETVRMYTDPTLLVDAEMADSVRETEAAKKQAALDALGVAKTQLRSKEQFAELLRAAGVEPPMKISKRTGQLDYAFSKQDLPFKKLLGHQSKQVRDLVAARFTVNSSILETRAQRFANRASIGAQPVYLKYWGAKTGRWSGGDKSNYQNLTRGSALRKSLHAPAKHKLVIADLEQIEARLNAWYNGQANIVEAFAKRQDVYALAASDIYHRPINKDDDPNERFVGKVAVLALGYQAGWARFAEMLRVGAFGPPVNITDEDAQSVVRAWRAANQYITAGWRRAQNNARNAFLGKQRIQDGVLIYEGFEGKGVTHIPGGTYIRYDRLRVDGDDNAMSYATSFKITRDGPVENRTKLYGGLVMENDIQALARRVVADHALQILDAAKSARLATSTHDELVFVVPNRSADKLLRIVNDVMSTPPAWAPDLPLAVAAHISDRYDK